MNHHLRIFLIGLVASTAIALFILLLNTWDWFAKAVSLIPLAAILCVIIYGLGALTASMFDLKRRDKA